jgi:hypothetical protein
MEPYRGIGVYFSSAGNYKRLKNLYRKGASNQGSEANKDVGSNSFFLFRLIRLRGGYFLQELYDCEKILTVQKVNADAPGAMRPLRLSEKSSNGPMYIV